MIPLKRYVGVVALSLWSVTVVIGLFIQPASGLQPPAKGLQKHAVPPAAAGTPPGPDGRKQGGVDLLGDPLPAGAIARMGTVGLRHHDVIRALALSPDGKTIASAGGGWNFPGRSLISLWDVATGKEVRQLSGHLSPPCGIVFSPDGKTLASAAGGGEGLMRDGTVRLWDVATGKQLHVLRGHLEPPETGPGRMCIAFSPDGKTLASSGQDGTVRLWDVAQGKELRRWRLDESSRPYCMAFSPNGRVLATLSSNNTRFHLWDTGTGKDLVAPEFPRATYWFQFTPDGKAVVAAGSDGLVRWLDLATGKELRRARGTLIATSADGKTVALHEKREIHLWDVAEGKERGRLPSPGFVAYQRYPFGFSYSSGGLSAAGRILVAADGNTIRVLDTRTGRQRHQDQGHTAKVVFVGFSPNGRELTSAGGAAVCGWDVKTGKELRRVSGDWRPIATAAMALDAKTLVLGSFEEPFARLLDVGRGKELCRLAAPWSDLLFPCVTLSPDGKTFAARLGPGTPTVVHWDVATGKEVRQFVYSNGGPRGDLSDAKAVTEAISSHPLSDPVGGKRMRDFEALRRVSYGDMGLAFSPDGRIAATGYPDPAPPRANENRTVALWEVASGKIIAQLRGHKGAVGALTFSPDGRVLASGGWDGTIRLWDITSGSELGRFQGSRGGVTSLAFSPDGKALASGGSDASALIWDVATLAKDRKSPAVQIAQEELGKLWTQLLVYDPSVAYRALGKLVADPERTVPFLRERLRQADPQEPLIRQLITELDDKRFEVRERAARELKGFGPIVEPALRRVLKGQPSEEVRKRLEEVLAALRPPAGQLPAYQLRGLRALQALEHIGTPAAAQALQALAKQFPQTDIGQEAKAAQERITKRVTKQAADGQ